jgi:hypothetical protein
MARMALHCRQISYLILLTDLILISRKHQEINGRREKPEYIGHKIVGIKC